MTTRSKNRRTPPPIGWMAIGLLLFITVPRLIPVSQSWLLFIHRSWDAITLRNSADLADRMSFGERILFTANTTDQQRGSEAFAKGDYSTAAAYFSAALDQRPNDPETAIYLNNARVGDRPVLRVGVSVPIGTNPNVAQEMLRGVAQAQEEINLKGGILQQGGILRAWLQIQIANDDNDPGIAKQIAEAFANDLNILAVIGHNASNASLAAAPIYEQSGLVMVSPTSFANALSGFGHYIFRTVPNIQAMATPLAEYVVRQKGLRRIAICYDSQAPDNVSFRDEFAAALSRLGGQVSSTVCDFAMPTFDPQTAMNNIRGSRAQGILLAPHIDRIHQAMALIRANQTQLPLFGSPTLYTMQTLQEGKGNVVGLTLSVPWFPTEPFAGNARRRWGGMVNWRTANSYDATQAVILGLQEATTRHGLQTVLRNTSFSASGASSSVRFLPTGDRLGNGILVQVISEAGRDRFALLAR